MIEKSRGKYELVSDSWAILGGALPSLVFTELFTASITVSAIRQTSASETKRIYPKSEFRSDVPQIVFYDAAPMEQRWIAQHIY